MGVEKAFKYAVGYELQDLPSFKILYSFLKVRGVDTKKVVSTEIVKKIEVFNLLA